MRRKIVNILCAALATFAISYLLTQWETGQLFPESTASIVEAFREADPMTYGILRDSPKTEEILADFKKTRDGKVLRERIGSLNEEIGAPALQRASDETAIEAIKSGKALFEAFAKYNRPACVIFLQGGDTAQTIQMPDIKPAYFRYSDGLFKAYESGKNGSEKTPITDDAVQSIMADNLSVNLPGDIDFKNDNLCETMIKIHDIDLVPEDLRASYARKLISGA